MIRWWRKARKNFETYQAALRDGPDPEMVRITFTSRKGQLDLLMTKREGYSDILHAYFGIQLYRDVDAYVKMGFSREEGEDMAWRYLEQYQHEGIFDFHYFRPVKIRHFQSRLSGHLQEFHPNPNLPIPGQLEHALSLVEHPQNTQMIVQTDEVFAYFQYAAQE